MQDLNDILCELKWFEGTSSQDMVFMGHTIFSLWPPFRLQKAQRSMIIPWLDLQMSNGQIESTNKHQEFSLSIIWLSLAIRLLWVENNRKPNSTGLNNKDNYQLTFCKCKGGKGLRWIHQVAVAPVLCNALACRLILSSSFQETHDGKNSYGKSWLPISTSWCFQKPSFKSKEISLPKPPRWHSSIRQ